MAKEKFLIMSNFFVSHNIVQCFSIIILSFMLNCLGFADVFNVVLNVVACGKELTLFATKDNVSVRNVS